jgi:hypothetical protein
MGSPVESGSEQLRGSESLALEHVTVSLRDGASDCRWCKGFARRSKGCKAKIKTPSYKLRCRACGSWRSKLCSCARPPAYAGNYCVQHGGLRRPRWRQPLAYS